MSGVHCDASERRRLLIIFFFGEEKEQVIDPSDHSAMASSTHDYRDQGVCTCLGPHVNHNERGQTYVYDEKTGEQIDYWSDTEDYLAHKNGRTGEGDPSAVLAIAWDWPNYDTAPAAVISTAPASDQIREKK